MSTQSSTPNSENPHSGDEHSQEALDQLDRELLVAERIRDYSDEIYMYTRQQWIDWKRRVDHERAVAAERGNGLPKSYNGHSNGHNNHHHLPTSGVSKHVAAAATGSLPNGKHAIEAVPIANGGGGGGEAVKHRQEPFNFYAPSSPVSELVRPQSAGYD